MKTVKPDGAKIEVQLLGSGVILNEVLRAQNRFEEAIPVVQSAMKASPESQQFRDLLERVQDFAEAATTTPD